MLTGLVVPDSLGYLDSLDLNHTYPQSAYELAPRLVTETQISQFNFLKL